MSQSSKSAKKQAHQNVLESLRDIGSESAKSLQDVLDPNAFIEQLTGLIKESPKKKISGNIEAGEAVSMKDILSGKQSENESLKKQVRMERNLREEQEQVNMEKTNQLRLQLKAIIQEVQKLAVATQDLEKEVKVAAMQAPVAPGIYHLVFFEKLFEFIKTYRKKVSNASIWMQATNKRAAKKDYWAKYKKHGSKFLLSGEHYLTRSAG